MGRTTDKELELPDGGPTDEELRAVKDVIVSFLIAVKNYAIYPEDHGVCHKSVASVKACLDKFLMSHGNLILDVEEDGLLFRGEVVHNDPAREGNVAFLLFRDGIQWLEFRKGLELDEITGLFKIMKQYKALDDEAEGDLVTALWEMDFAHLRYEAADVLWETEPLIDPSDFKVAEDKHNSIDRQEEKQEPSTSIADSAMDGSTWELTPAEIKTLGEMVVEEKKLDSTEDVVDLLVVILKEQSNQQSFSSVIEFINEEFQDMLAQGEFGFAFKLLKNLHEIYRSCKTEKPWALPLLDDFFLAISSHKVLGVLQHLWPAPDKKGAYRLKMLRRVLLLLRPEAILTLGPLLFQMQSSRAQRQLMEIIKSLANRDIRPLEQLLDSPEESLVRRLVYILGQLKGEKTTELLLKMINHSAQRVRKEAVTALLLRDPRAIQQVFHLVEDASHTMRRFMMEYMGRRGDRLTESLLLDYLEKRQFKRRDREHLLACYRAIGQCGSSRSIPFLRGVLLNRGWIPGFGRSSHRQGAVMALMALGTEEAQEILDKASRSLLPTVRCAYRNAAGENKKQAGAKH
ncbi:MAG: HEAT repeat domain-containing protein [Pseudomonadota bacterium]